VFARHSQGYARAMLVDSSCGSVHTGLTLNRLEPGGQIAPHLHSFEESVYILEGRLEATLGEAPAALGAGDFAVIKVGVLHAWRNAGTEPVRWLEMNAPQPKASGDPRDTFFPSTAHLGVGRGQVVPTSHFDASQIPPEDQRPAGLAKGVFLKWLIDEPFGAVHHRLVFIEYQPGAAIAPHDHTFEEAYFITGGEVEAVVDGERHLVGPGDVVWTAVGCVHSFKNIGSGPVRWLETFSPQPPKENVFRFLAEWDARAADLEA
jgi:quercetin dioxygenase-like cupin family protein